MQKAESPTWKRIKPLMKLPEALDELVVPVPADVTLEDLSFGYTEEPIFFAGLDLTAHPGRSSALRGRCLPENPLWGVYFCESFLWRLGSGSAARNSLR